MELSSQQIEKRLQEKDYDNGVLECWFRRSLKEGEFSICLNEDLNKALSANFPSCYVQFADINYKDLSPRCGALKCILGMQEQGILPIVVVRIKGEMWVVDGRHRCEAAQYRGRNSIRP